MSTDRIDCYAIGKSRHRPCQDAVAAGLAADGRETPDYDRFGRGALHRARVAAAVLRLPPDALDATLMTAFRIGERVVVYVYGDGFVLTRDRATGTLRCTEFRYPDNAPCYLSYRDRPRRLRAYRRRFACRLQIRSDTGPVRTVDARHPTRMTFSCRDVSLVMLASDGLASFRPLAALPGGLAPTLPPAALFGTFKHTRGAFLQRRARRALRELDRRGCVPGDDLSLAAMIPAGREPEP